ncbi:MAG: hypothetical protein WBM00_07490, partial [Solirubrobacterales bacterium]
SYTAADSGGAELASVELWVKAPGVTEFELIATENSPGPSGSFPYTAEAGEGTYRFYTRARDSLGNYEPVPASADSNTVFDTTPPQTTIDSGPTGPTNDSTPTFTFSSSELSSFKCSIDASGFVPCASPFAAAPLGDGVHTFEVKATDAAENTDPTPASATFLVDTVAPTSQASSPEAGGSTTIPVSYAAADSGGAELASVELWVRPPGAFEYKLVATDSSPASPGSFSYTAVAGSGTYRFYTRALDRAGNHETAPPSPDAATVLEGISPTILPSITISPGSASPAAPTLAGPSSSNAPASVQSTFHLIRIASHPRRDFATVTLHVPGPGTLTLFGKKVKRVRVAALDAGSLRLAMRLKKQFEGALQRTKIKITYAPLAGNPVTLVLTVKL